MKKYKFLFLLILILTVVSTGCQTDSKEIDDQVYTLIIGADRGVDNIIKLTVMYPTYKGGGGSESTEGANKQGVSNESIIQTVEASSILEAINLLNTSMPRRISLVHTKMMVFSEDFARKGISNYLQPLARFRETRRIMQVVVCKGSAQEFIKENKSVISDNVSKAIELMSAQSDNNGYFPKVSFHEFYSGTISPYGQAYTVYAGINKGDNLRGSGSGEPQLKTQQSFEPGEIPKIGGPNRELVGTAVFDGDKMIGSLNTYETRYFLMVIGKFQKGTITIEDENMEGKAIPLDVRLGRKPKIKAYLKDGKPVIDITLNIEADIGAIQSRINYEKLGKIDDLNNYIGKTIKKGVEDTIKKTQKEFESDIFNFGAKIARHFFTIDEFEDYNWLAQYKDAKVNVQVEANVRRTGLMMESVPIRNKESKIKSKAE